MKYLMMKRTKILVSVLILIISNVIGSQISQIHYEEPSPGDHIAFFGIDVKEEYEIVPIHVSNIQGRKSGAGTHINIKAFHENIDLWLKPIDESLASSHTPVYAIREGHNIKKYSQNLMNKVVSKMYEDTNHAATVTMNRGLKGDVELNGLLGTHNIYIHPVYDHISNFLEKIGKYPDIPKYESSNDRYHILYKLPVVPESMRVLKPPSLNITTTSKRSAIPDTVYPEIMVIMDYPLYTLLGGDIYNAVAYVLSFWHGVDLKYRSLENPNYRLNVAGIVIAMEKNALEYMRHRLNYPPYDFLVEDALDHSSFWLVDFEKKLEHNHFDLAITMTSEIFCTMEAHTCERGTVGLAFAFGACSPKRLVKQGRYSLNTMKTGIIHDKSGYQGITVAAHEVAHVLGAWHDGEHNQKCSGRTGYLMAPTVSITPHASDWSYCTAQDFEKFIKSRNAECLFNKPATANRLTYEKVPSFLPGKIATADEQCYRLYGTEARVIDESTCRMLDCRRLNGQQSEDPDTGAADGTPCGNGKICLHGNCIDESLTNVLQT